MEHTCPNRRVKTLYLKAMYVEPILLSCIEGSSNYDLSLKVQTVIPIPHLAMKIYLFHLIDKEFISYNGEKKIYLIKQSGYDLLNAIYTQKRINKVDRNQLIIQIK